MVACKPEKMCKWSGNEQRRVFHKDVENYMDLCVIYLIALLLAALFTKTHTCITTAYIWTLAHSFHSLRLSVYQSQVGAVTADAAASNKALLCCHLHASFSLPSHHVFATIFSFKNYRTLLMHSYTHTQIRLGSMF